MATFFAALLELADLLLLVLGQHFRNDPVGTHLLADGLGGFLMVAGEHHHFNAHLLQLLDGFLAGGLHHVRHRNHAQKRSSCRKVQGSLSFLRHPVLQLIHGGILNRKGAHHFVVACQALHSLHGACNALAGNLLELIHRQEGDIFLLCLFHNGGG